MAFRAPKAHASQRAYTSNQPTRDETFAEASPASNTRLEDSQEWILFSPAQPSVPDTILSHTTSTDQTNRTAGRSRLSDYGSLGTEVRSWEAGTEDVHESTIHEDDDEELDSLDSHLLEFRSNHSSHYHNGREEETPHGLLSQHLIAQEQEAASHSVFPNHDGLGSFQLGRRPASNPASPQHEHQDFQFPSQQHNQRRTKRRRESLDLILAREQSAREQEEEKEREKRSRIEEWRMEQSRAIMEEVQKESRRQRQRIAGKRTNTLKEYHEGEMASMGGVLGDAFDDMNMSQPKLSNHVEEEGSDKSDDGFWQRITRRVIQDLMGIDDKLLGILFGESLSDDLEMQLNNAEGGNPLHAGDSGWENRLLERIARELGLLVNQISDHPGAFTTYLRVQQEPLPYAGLPIIPEAQPEVKEEPVLSPVETSATQQSNFFFTPTIPQAISIAKPEPVVYDPISSSRHYFDSEMDYLPTPAPAATVPTTNLSTSHVSSVNQLPSYSIRTVTSTPLVDSSPTPRAAASSSGFTKEEWEKQLDIGLVFRYLRSRFSSRKAAAHPPFQRHHSSPADQAARAARVRQHHPLVAGRPVVERRTSSYKATIPQTAAASVAGGQQRRRSSSCASQSTKVSVSQRSRRLSGSSRHYWDIACGGSLGSGSIIVSTGGMGGWGDV